MSNRVREQPSGARTPSASKAALAATSWTRSISNTRWTSGPRVASARGFSALEPVHCCVCVAVRLGLRTAGQGVGDPCMFFSRVGSDENRGRGGRHLDRRITSGQDGSAAKVKS